MKTLTRSILDLTRSSKNAVSIQCGRRFISSIKATNLDNALLVYGEIPNKSYLQVRGPDTIGFLNGLVTSKLLPTFVKKNLTTIEVSDEKIRRTLIITSPRSSMRRKATGEFITPKVTTGHISHALVSIVRS